MVNSEPVDALAMIINREQAEIRGRAICLRLKNLIPRQLFKVALQAAIGGKVIARENTKIFSSDNNEIGFVTSGTFGPSVNAPVAMGYVKSEFSEVGTSIQLEVRAVSYTHLTLPTKRIV